MMNYYEVYSKLGRLLAKGNARECAKKLGCASIDCFYTIVQTTRQGTNKKYRVVTIKGGETDYPVLGKDHPFHKMERLQKTQAETTEEEK